MTITESEIKASLELNVASVKEAMGKLVRLSRKFETVSIRFKNFALAAAMILAEGDVVKYAEKYLAAWPIFRWYWKRKLLKAKEDLNKALAVTEEHLNEHKDDLQEDSK